MASKTILVVDDEDVIVSIISKSLKKEGYHIVTANDHKSALHLTQKTSVDLVVSDVMMPHTGGFELVELLKENPGTRRIPVILVTGMDRDIIDASHVQADAIILKPFDMELLIHTIRAQLNRL